MKLQGKILVINESETFGNFTKRSFVIETDEKFPQQIEVELHQDRVDLIDKYKVGDKVDVSINIRGRKWTNPEGVDKYFNSIVGWRIENMSAGGPTQSNNEAHADPGDYKAETEGEESLPF